MGSKHIVEAYDVMGKISWVKTVSDKKRTRNVLNVVCIINAVRKLLQKIF